MDNFNEWSAQVMGWKLTEYKHHDPEGWGYDEGEAWVDANGKYMRHPDHWNPATDLNDMRLVEIRLAEMGAIKADYTFLPSYADALIREVKRGPMLPAYSCWDHGPDGGSFDIMLLATASVSQRKAAIEAIQGEIMKAVEDGK